MFLWVEFCFVFFCVSLMLLLFRVDQRLKINMLSTFWLFLYSHLHFIWEFMYRQTVGTPPKLTMKVKASELKVNLSRWNESVILIGVWCKLVLSPSTVKTFTFSYQPEPLNHWLCPYSMLNKTFLNCLIISSLCRHKSNSLESFASVLLLVAVVGCCCCYWLLLLAVACCCCCCLLLLFIAVAVVACCCLLHSVCKHKQQQSKVSGMEGGIDCSWGLANLCCWIQDPLTVLSLDTGD